MNLDDQRERVRQFAEYAHEVGRQKRLKMLQDRRRAKIRSYLSDYAIQLLVERAMTGVNDDYKC